MVGKLQTASVVDEPRNATVWVDEERELTRFSQRATDNET